MYTYSDLRGMMDRYPLIRAIVEHRRAYVLAITAWWPEGFQIRPQKEADITADDGESSDELPR